MSKYSENEDDPDVYESSGEEWKEAEVKKNSRRSSQRLSRKPRKTVVEYNSSDEDEEDGSDSEPKKKKSKNGVSKKKPKQEVEDDEDHNDEENEEDEEDDDENFSDKESHKVKSEKSSPNSESKVVSTTATSNSGPRSIHRKFIPKTIFSEDYATGSFVILKKDAQVGDPAKHPCIWRIDGKALLQKYEAFDDEGKVRHKNTSIYTGWSPMDKDLYAPVTVDVVQHNNQNLTVELHWDKLKSINVDSD